MLCFLWDPEGPIEQLFLPAYDHFQIFQNSRILTYKKSGHRACLATSKRCFNKGGAAYFLARDQYVQKISKSKTRQDKWRSIQRRNQRSLDPWGKPVKPRAKCSLLSSCSQQIGSSSKQHLIRKYNEYNFHTWCALSIVEGIIPKEQSGWECQDTLNEIHSCSQAA